MVVPAPPAAGGGPRVAGGSVRVRRHSAEHADGRLLRGEVATSAAVADPPSPAPALLASGSAVAWQARLGTPGMPERYLPRPALEARTREGSRRRLLLVTGPAGQGKTTTVAAALRAVPSVAWVTLEPADRHPEVLLHDILRALGAVTGTALVDPTSAADPEETLLAACDHLLSLDREIVLVLDDAAADAFGAAAVRLLDGLLDRMPRQLHLVVLARHRPRLAGIERRRARGEVVELGAAELAFTDHEAAAYLRSWGLTLDAQALRTVCDSAEGWPIALRLLAGRLHGADEPRQFVARVGSGVVTVAEDYVQELLTELDEEDRRFLLDVAVLDELEPERCARISGQTGCAERLGYLAGVGLIVPAGSGRGRYRHRPLIRRLLEVEQLVGDPGRWLAAHAAAASWFAQHAAWQPAIQHALAAGDHARASAWLETHRCELARVGGGAWLSSMLDRLPVETLVGRQALLRTRADLGVAMGDRDGLERLLAAVEDPAFDGAVRKDERPRLRAYLSRLRGDGVEPLLRHQPHRGLEPLTSHPLGVALAAEGRHNAAATAFRCALEDARLAGDPVRELVVTSDLAWQQATAGHLIDAELLGRRAAKLAEEHGFDLPLSVHLARAQVALDRGRTDVARARASSIRTAAVLGYDLVILAEAALFESRARWAHGDVDGAVRALDQLDRDLRDEPPGGGLLSRIVRARASLLLALDDTNGAVALLPTLAGGGEGLPPEDLLIAALFHLRRREPARARELVAPLRDAGIGPRLSIHALRIESSALAMLGDEQAAASCARRAEEIARAQGLLALPIHRRPPATRGRTPAPAVADDERVGEDAAGHLAVELTVRELDVLRMLPSATNGEIATNLYVSVNTVKTHLKSLHRKLEVATREAAVLRARELGLI
jgi:LuxR family transcriptional regulator, maltose regulon positive regulatory protein